jgi:hypothetical protein
MRWYPFENSCLKTGGDFGVGEGRETNREDYACFSVVVRVITQSVSHATTIKIEDEGIFLKITRFIIKTHIGLNGEFFIWKKI